MGNTNSGAGPSELLVKICFRTFFLIIKSTDKTFKENLKNGIGTLSTK